MNDSTDKVSHLCVGCGYLVPMCVCDPTGGDQHESELAFRQELRDRLKRIEEKLDQLREGDEEIPIVTTTLDDFGIFNIDGPPVNAFAIAENPDGSGNRVEIVYRVVRFQGNTLFEVQEAWAKIFRLVQSELRNLGAIQENPRFVREIIWWRRRPEFHPHEEYFRCYARFATTPPLPDRFWDEFGAKLDSLDDGPHVKDLLL